jgi:G3E family GTPase
MSVPYARSNAIPVTILTGFLGAGKTTLLNRILSGDHGLRVAVLVNDFGAINVDAELVVGVEDDMISLANGCVCCQVRDDLVEAIDDVIGRSTPVDCVLLEASGIADPAAIFVTFTDSKYRDRIRVDSITCVVDAEQVLKEDDPEQAAILKLRQIGFADLVILNKADLAGDELVAKVRAWIDSYLNRVRVVETTQCQVPLSVVLGTDRPDLPVRRPVIPFKDGSHERDHGQDFATWSYETKEPLSIQALREMIKRRLPRGVYRCKGIIYSTDVPEQRCVLQVVGRRSDLTIDRPWNDESPATRIVAIGALGDIDSEELKALFDSCIAGRREQVVERLAGVRTTRI